MRSSERTILFGLVILAVVALFWFLVLGPKRAELGTTQDDVAAAQEELSAQQAIVDAGIQARDNFSADYATMVELGKAVPPSADTPNLLLQMSNLADTAKVDFRSITLSSASGAVGPEEEDSGETTTSTSETSTPQPVAPTETAVATAPLGSTTGPAGLPVMPYALLYRAGFFNIADYFKEIDGMVKVKKNGTIEVEGRLLTIDGFVLSEDPVRGFPYLVANVAVTSYLTPADQGLFAGAGADGPLAATEGAQ